MKNIRKWLVLVMIFNLIITSSLITTVHASSEQLILQEDFKLTEPAGKVPGNSNPLITHKYGADPYALVYDGRIYLYMTDDQAQWELTPDTSNSYSNCRSVSIISSADMVNWTDHGKVPVGRQLPNALTRWANNAWAPAAAYKEINGEIKFFLYFADSANGIGVLVGDSPIGPFHDPLGKALIDRNTPNCQASVVPWLFDPAVLVDDDGKAYIYFAGGIDGLDANNPKSARMVQLGDDMISIVGIPQEIDAPRLFEDSGIHKYNGKYYYSYCSNFSGRNGEGYPPTGTIAYMVSDNPLGPFEYIGPILPGPGVFGNGDGGNNHHAIFEFEGNWYITYHTRQVNIAQRRINGQSGHRDYRSPSISKINIDPETGLIEPLVMENKGVSLLKTMNPYTRVEAETIAWNGGIATETSSQPGSMIEGINMQVTSINSGDWIAVSGLDFGDKGAAAFTAKVASGSAGGVIELRLDSAEGPVIGTLPIGFTGGWDNWVTKTTSISGATGVHDVYMIFKGNSSEELFKFDYWKFEEKNDEHELIAINATIDKQKIDVDSQNNAANMTVTAIYADGTTEDVTTKAAAVPEQEGIVNIKDGVVTGIGFGTTKINVSYGGKTDMVSIIVKSLEAEQTVKTLTVDKSSVTLDVGATTTFTVTAEYMDGHTEDVTTKATYNNPNPAIAEVSNGTIRALSGGTTNVTISFKGEMGDAATTQISVTVNVPAVLAIEAETAAENTDRARMYSSATHSWTIVNGQSTQALELTPDTGWNMSSTDAASLAAAPRLEYKLNFNTAGTYYVWLLVKSYNWDSDSIHVGLDNSYKFTYNGIHDTSLGQWRWVRVGSISGITTGEHVLNLWGREDGLGIDRILLTTSPSTSDPTWPSNNVTGVTLDKNELSLLAGSTETLTATVIPATAANKKVTFTSDNEAVAKITEAVYDAATGKTIATINAIAPGTATITATTEDGKFTAACTVNVESVPSDAGYIVNTTFSANSLIANDLFTAKVNVQNISAGNDPVLAIVALYDAKGRMVSVTYISKVIAPGKAEVLNAGFKLPEDVTGHCVKVFVWDGINLESTNMQPLSNVALLYAQD